MRSVFSPEMEICEIGFAGGHFLEWLDDIGLRNLTGIEIREGQYNKTSELFSQKHLGIRLILGDVLNFDETFDGVYSTGLLQCLNTDSRLRFLDHVSKLADLAFFTVPEIIHSRNMESNQEIAVAGCKEFSTGNIAFELSEFYDSVRVGRMEKTILNNEDTFLYYICRKEKRALNTEFCVDCL